MQCAVYFINNKSNYNIQELTLPAVMDGNAQQQIEEAGGSDNNEAEQV